MSKPVYLLWASVERGDNAWLGAALSERTLLNVSTGVASAQTVRAINPDKLSRLRCDAVI